MIDFKTINTLAGSLETDMLIVRVFEEETKSLARRIKHDEKSAALLAGLVSQGDFRAKFKEVLVVFPHSPLLPPRIALLGLGKKTEYTLELARQAISAIAPMLDKHSVKTLSVLTASKLPKDSASPEEAIAAATEGLLLALYRFEEYKRPEPNAARAKIESIVWILNRPAERTKVLRGARRGEILAETTNYTRSLANHPGNYMTPEALAEEAKTLSRKYKLACKILEKGDMKKLGMNALLAVNQGSALPPKFIVLEYIGKKSAPLTVLVGKGITFDSGGISLKPGKAMDEMKFDMCGAAAVLGTLRAAAELKLPLRLVGLVPATENLPSGSAVKPGDVVKAMSGKTIEVLNTDAEGRMILADALAYAARYKPKLVIDLATLTGACVVALGTEYAGAFATDERLLSKLKKAADKTGEKLWPLPLAPEYEEDIKSPVADIKNIGMEGKGGGTITAALFLKEFVSYPWIHLDIAGTAWTTSGRSYHPKGATGYGVRLLVEFLR